MIRTLPRLLAVLAAVLATMPVGPAGAVPIGPAAAQPVTPTLTWAVQPADREGPDGRRWIELTLDPGQVVTERLAVRNFSDKAITFSLKAADGYLTANGRFNMLPSHQASTDGGTWIKVQEKVTVGADETKVVPFTITVPPDATPGDHPAGIAATVTSAGGTVAVESRVGFRVMTRVSGTITASLAVDGLTATYRHSWNPFSAGTIRVGYTATNDGNVAVTGTGRVRSAELFGLADHEARAGIAEMLPGGGREIVTHVTGVWGLGRLRTAVEVTPVVAGGGPAGAAIRPASATVTVWTLPWPQLALAALIGAAAVAFRVVTRRRRQRLADLLARARDEGRAEGREPTLVGSRVRRAGK